MIRDPWHPPILVKVPLTRAGERFYFAYDIRRVPPETVGARLRLLVSEGWSIELPPLERA